MSSNKEKGTSSSSTESDLEFDTKVHKTYYFRKSATQQLDTEFFNTDSENANPKKTPPEPNYSTVVNLSSSSDEVNVTVDTEYECQSQLSVDMPGPSNKTMETRFRKSATQELDTEFFNTDSENANPKKTPPDSDELLNYCKQIFQSQDTEATLNLSSSSDQGNVTVDSEYECQSQLSVDMPGPSNKPMETRFECTQDIGNESQYISQYISQDISQDIHLPGPSSKPLTKQTSCELTQNEDDGDDDFDSETTANSSSDTVIVSDTQNETERLSQYVVGEPTQYQSQDIFPPTLSQPSQNLERSDRRKSHVNYLHSSDASSSSTDQDFVPVESESPALITRQNAMYIHKQVVPAKRNIESTDSEDEFLPPPKK